MVGEIRDHDTLEIAINASLTGHLVLSTIHTNDAAGAVTRTIDMGAEPFLLRSSVIGILAQRLVRVLCPNCKYQYPAEDFELEELGLTPERMRTRAARRNNPASRYFPRNVRRPRSVETFDPPGARCSRRPRDATRAPTPASAAGAASTSSCSWTTRWAAHPQKADAQAIKRAAQDMGMDTLRDDGARKVLAGMTTVEEVLAATQEDVEAELLASPSVAPPARAGAEAE